MRLPIFHFKEGLVDIIEFTDFWSRLYIYTEEESLYNDIIFKSVFDKADIEKLFQWKNGMPINGHSNKQGAVAKVIGRLDALNGLKVDFDLESFKHLFFDMSAIWQLFLLHIVRPDFYPIFDQHVYRAHVFLKSGVIAEIRESNKFKLSYFYDDYLPFFTSFELESDSSRKLDKALWAFGKFLKTPYAALIVDVDK